MHLDLQPFLDLTLNGWCSVFKYILCDTSEVMDVIFSLERSLIR